MNKNYILSILLIFALVPPSFSQNLIVSGGSRFTVAVAEDGSVYTWGNNNAGQLGIGTTGGMYTAPVRVNFPDLPNQPGVKPKIVKADAGMGSHALAIDDNGNVWAWGCNCDGQLGNRNGGRSFSQLNISYYDIVEACSTLVNNVPVMVAGGEQGGVYLSDIVYISAGEISSYAIDASGKMWSWGSNFASYYNGFRSGLLGNGTQMNFSNVPVAVKTLNNEFAVFTQVDAGMNVTYALDEEGFVWAWGNNRNSQLGNGYNWSGNSVNDVQPTAARVKKGTYINGFSNGNGEFLDGIVEISAGLRKGMFLDIDGYVWAVGANYQGNSGLSSNGGPDAKFAAKISAPANYSSETYFSGVNSFASEGAISSSENGGAVIKQIENPDGTTRGELYTFGLNYTYRVTGELSEIGGASGQGDCRNTSYYMIPTKVRYFSKNGQLINADNLNVTGVSDGNGVFYIITQDPNTLNRELWVMGANNKGQLGLGDTNSTYCVPTLLTGAGAGFTLASPCPKMSSAFYSYKQFCGTISQVLEVPGQQSNYSYKWITPFNGYTIKNYGTHRATANEYAVTLNSNSFSNEIKYSAEVSVIGKNCPSVTYDFIFAKYPDGFSVPASTGLKNQSFCSDSAFVNLKSLHPSDTPVYSYYPSAISKVKMASSKGSSTVAFKLPSGLATNNTNTMTIYAQETASRSGMLFKKSEACDPDFNYSGSPSSYQSGFVTYQDTVIIKSITIRVICYPQSDSISVQIPIRLFLSKKDIGGYQFADRTRQIGLMNYTFRRKGLTSGQYIEEIEIPVSFKLYPYGTYFLGFENNSNFYLAHGNCNMTFPVHNKGNRVISFIGTSSNFSNPVSQYNMNQGVFFDIQYETGQKYCERKPVVLTNTCVITGQENNSSIQENGLMITPNPSSSYFVVNSTLGGTLTIRNSSGQMIDNTTLEPNENLQFGEKWSAGLYFIQLSGNGITTTSKVIKY